MSSGHFPLNLKSHAPCQGTISVICVFWNEWAKKTLCPKNRFSRELQKGLKKVVELIRKCEKSVYFCTRIGARSLRIFGFVGLFLKAVKRFAGDGQRIYL